MSEIIDAQERLSALDTTRSFCVQAPAGSGKTELLTQRILKLLAICSQPEEILAFTFTRKAAAEMRSRLLQSLHDASIRSAEEISNLAPHSKMTHDLASAVLSRNKEEDWHLLENTQRLRITTIDAFNAFITSQLPIISAFGSQPEISKDMELIYQKAVQETLSQLEGDPEIARNISILLSHLNNNLNNVQGLLCQLLRNRDQWLSHILSIKFNPERLRTEIESGFSELIEEALSEAEILLNPYRADICKLLRFAADNLDAAGSPELKQFGFSTKLPQPSVESCEHWKAIANFFLTRDAALRKTVTVKNGFPKAADGKDSIEKEAFKEHKDLFIELVSEFANHEDILSTFQNLIILPNASYDEEQWHILSALTAILPRMVSHLSVTLQQQGQVDYVQVSSAALEALGSEENPTDLAMRLDYKIKHILVDEFQDTSSLQSNLIEKLTWGWEPEDGRTLFIVGDGMQSCYGFRNANVGLFLSARDNGIGAVKLNSVQLQVNFRSESTLVNWVNNTFSKAFPADDDISRGAVAYSHSVAIHNNQVESGVETLLWLNNKDNELELDKRLLELVEAKQVVKQCQSLLKNHPGSSIAILVRSRPHLQAIVPALRAAEIEWNASGIDSLASYSEISDLIILLKALTNLSDKTALFALLRTPFVGIRLVDIHSLSDYANNNELSLWTALTLFQQIPGLSEDALTRFNRVMPVLITSRLNRQQQALRDWLENTWLLLGGPATLKSEMDLSYIDTFFRALEDQSQHNEILDIHDFEEKITKIYVTGKHDPAIKLQIMTIHNAKGLEFDFVLIPGLDRSPRPNDKPLILYKEHLNHYGQEKLLLSILGKKGGKEDSIYRYLHHEGNLRNKMENTRLLYIAVTRAAQKTFLYGRINTSKGKYSPPPSSSLLFSIWPQLNPDNLDNRHLPKIKELTESNTDQADHFKQASCIQLNRLQKTWRNPLSAIKTLQVEVDIDRDTIEKTHHNLLEKKMGDIIHECLRLKVEKNMRFASNDGLTALNQFCRLQLKQICDPQQMEASLTRIKQNLNNCEQHEKADWLFNPRHTESACELALSDYRSTYRKQFFIDRTFVDSNNIRWIIDYKSSKPKPGQNLNEFCHEQKNIYQKQLDTYAQLFQTMEAREVKTALFFTDIPHWLETSI